MGGEFGEMTEIGAEGAEGDWMLVCCAIDDVVGLSEEDMIGDRPDVAETTIGDLVDSHGGIADISD